MHPVGQVRQTEFKPQNKEPTVTDGVQLVRTDGNFPVCSITSKLVSTKTGLMAEVMCLCENYMTVPAVADSNGEDAKTTSKV